MSTSARLTVGDLRQIRPACARQAQSSGSDPTQPGWGPEVGGQPPRARASGAPPPTPAPGSPVLRLVWGGSLRARACPGPPLLLATGRLGASSEQSSAAWGRAWGRKPAAAQPLPHLGWGTEGREGVKPRPLELVPAPPSRGPQHPQRLPLVCRPSRLSSRPSLCRLGRGSRAGWRQHPLLPLGPGCIPRKPGPATQGKQASSAPSSAQPPSLHSSSRLRSVTALA